MFRLFSKRDDDESSSESFHVPTALFAPQSFEPLRLRPMRVDDMDEWSEVKQRNGEWLRPWESGDPMHAPAITFSQWIAQQRRSERRGEAVMFVVELRGRIIGQISLGAICYGSMRVGTVGYWIDRGHAGHGYAPLAVALLADWAISSPTGPRLHRLEIAILPENERSRRVAEKLGLPMEGLRRNYMYVNGRWRDHDVYVLLASDVQGAVIDRLR